MYREIANACISTSLIRKFDYKEQCEACGVDLSDGTGYECGICGDLLCENDLIDDQYGLPGYRGSIDDDNPDIQRLFDSGAVNNSGLAVCGQCMSAGEDEYESIMEEREQEMREMREEEEESRREAEERSKNFYGYGSQEALDRALQDRLQNIGDEMRRDRVAMGREYIGYGFPRDFQEKNASEDEAFRSAWDVVKSE